MRLIRVTLLIVFVAGAVTAVAVRGTGYSWVEEDGRYFRKYHSDQIEITRDEYEDKRWRDDVVMRALAAMILSMFVFGLIESHRLRERARRRRPTPKLYTRDR